MQYGCIHPPVDATLYELRPSAAGEPLHETQLMPDALSHDYANLSFYANDLSEAGPVSASPLTMSLASQASGRLMSLRQLQR